MKSDPISTALAAIDKKLDSLLSSRASIDRDIVCWKHAKDSLLAIIESEESDPPDVEISGFVDGKPGRQTIKFSDAVRLVLQQHTKDTYISAPEIRQYLLNLGVDLSAKAQPLTPIHNCLRRLAEQGEAYPVKNDEGQIIGYKWISPIERALDENNNFYDVIGQGITRGTVNRAKTLGIGPNHPLRKSRNEVFERWKEAHDAKLKREAMAKIDTLLKEIKKSHEEAK